MGLLCNIVIEISLNFTQDELKVSVHAQLNEGHISLRVSSDVIVCLI